MSTIFDVIFGRERRRQEALREYGWDSFEQLDATYRTTEPYTAYVSVFGQVPKHMAEQCGAREVTYPAGTLVKPDAVNGPYMTQDEQGHWRGGSNTAISGIPRWCPVEKVA